MRAHWTGDKNRLLRLRGRPIVEGKNLVNYDNGESRLCLLDGVHGESVEREFGDDGELGRVKRDNSGHLLEVCRCCGDDLGLPRDADGLVDRKRGGQSEYCGDDCKRLARNARDRRRRARSRRKRTPANHPIVPPCWASDPWLKFWLKGSVPIGKGRVIDYADPTGDTAVMLVESPDLRPLYLEESGPGVPVGKPIDIPPYRHSVFDSGFAGPGGYYRRLVLAAAKW